MELHEKLAQLRNEKNLTQEQLAAALYVSRTAISKWESGKGCPSIESLKCISRYFSVSIDVLLSGEELVTLAQNESRSQVKIIYEVISCLLDIASVLFLVLPLYGKPSGDYVYHVNLLANTHEPNMSAFLHWGIFSSLIALGIFRLACVYFKKEGLFRIASPASLAVGAGAICLFAAAREPYATILLFLLFGIKLLLLWKQITTQNACKSPINGD